MIFTSDDLDRLSKISSKHIVYSGTLAVIIFIIDLQIPLGVAGGVPYIAVIFLALGSPNPRCVISFAIVCSILTMLGFILSPEGGELWKVIANRSLALFAIWITAIIGLKWKASQLAELKANLKTEKEKEKIYNATIHGAKHVTYNLLNGLQLVEMEIKNHPKFDQSTKEMFDDMLKEAKFLMDELSSVSKVDEDTIKKSIYPK